MCLSAPVPKQAHKKPKSPERGDILHGYSSENYRNSTSKAKNEVAKFPEQSFTFSFLFSLFLVLSGFFNLHCNRNIIKRASFKVTSILPRVLRKYIYKPEKNAEGRGQ